MLHSDHHVYAIDALNSEKPSDKSAAPDFQGENPSHDAIVKWLDAWDAHLATTGFAPMLAGRDLTSVSHLIEGDLTAFPEVTDGMSDLQKSNLIEKRCGRNSAPELIPGTHRASLAPWGHPCGVDQVKSRVLEASLV